MMLKTITWTAFQYKCPLTNKQKTPQKERKNELDTGCVLSHLEAPLEQPSCFQSCLQKFE